MCSGNCFECEFDDCIATEKEIMDFEKKNPAVVVSQKEIQTEKKKAYIREYQKKYYAEHKAEISARHRKWYLEKADYIRKVNNEKYKEYYKQHRDEILQKKKEARAWQKEECLQKQ